MSHGTITYDKERVHFNLGRLKTHGQTFEVVVDPDLAIAFKESLHSKNADAIDIQDVLKSEEIFSDASQGVFAPESEFMEIFSTEDVLEIAKQILTKGEIQITAEHRSKIRDMKKKKIIDIIHREAIDPRTNLPHPPNRIEAAIDDSKAKIDEYKKAEDQVKDVVHAINAILPIKFDHKRIVVTVYSDDAKKMYGFFNKWNKQNEAWNDDGSLTVTVEIPAGLQNEFFDELNGMTHGGNETKIIE